MYPNNFFIQNPTMRYMPNGLGMLPNKTGGIFSIFKNTNWSNLLNNANRTLNFVNQTIPLVRQVGPMINNMKSMIKLASAFKDETDIKPKQKNITNDNSSELNNNPSTTNTNDINNNQPNFFI